MRILVTGSAGHLGEALVRTLRDAGHHVVALDVLPGATTTVVGSIVDRSCVRRCMRGVDAVLHTATLHKPHVASHPMQAFVDTNISGTLVLLDEAQSAGVGVFVFTSTTSAFGHAMRPPADSPAAWVTEALQPIPRNIYGVTKTAAEDLCELAHRRHGIPVIVLRTSRFFPEEDDHAATRCAFVADNAKVNEFAFRRVEIEDVISAHQCALDAAARIGFGKYIISATTPFLPEDIAALRTDAPAVLSTRVPEYADIYERRGWRMFPAIDRVYVNDAARDALGWRPRYDFRAVLAMVDAGQAPRSELAASIGRKGYHAREFAEGPYPTDC